MKNKNYSLFLKLPLFAAVVCLVLFLYGFNKSPEAHKDVISPVNTASQIKPLAAKIQQLKNSGKVFAAKELFSLNSSAQVNTVLGQYLKISLRLSLMPLCAIGF